MVPFFLIEMKLHWHPKLNKILIHLLFWVLIVFYFAWGFGFDTNPKGAFLNAAFFLPGFMLMVYSLLYFLVPRYLIQRKYFKFFLGLILVLVACISYGLLAQVTLLTNDKLKGFDIRTGRAILPFLNIAGIALSIKLLRFWFKQKQQTLEAQQQATLAELQLLKSQLHPHFLFNTLNNLYYHTLSHSPTAPEIVVKLSNVLRFIIYESNSTKIPLIKEINLLQEYIALEKLRYGDRLDMSMVVNGDLARFQIAPLLLLPFLENAFKHGASKQIDQCWISFNLAINDSIMNFKLVNSLDTDNYNKTHKIGGLGLQNVKRRLELLYRNKYNFETIMTDGIFIVILDITLEELQ